MDTDVTTDFENDVKSAFIKAKLGDQTDKTAPVDLHFVLPLKVFERYEALIEEVTADDFEVAAGYNLVLLYTNAEDSQRAGTVLFGRDLDGLIAAWSNVLDDIAADPDKTSQLEKFKGAHSYFRSALWLEPNPSDPCASANPLPKNAKPSKRSFWSRFSK